MNARVCLSVEEARKEFGFCALAIGNFDGVHIGHLALLRKAASFSSQHNLLRAALTFDPHPTAIVAPHRRPEMLVSIRERLELLAAAGVERILVLPFTERIAKMTPEEFVKDVLLDTLHVRAVFVGETFRFGAKQAGTADTLRRLGEQFGFESHFLAPVSYRGETVSSSAIRQHLASGRLSRANRLLGRNFTIRGPVVRGHGIGSKQTVPTLNLRHTPGQVVPRGVFVTETVAASPFRQWPSITNVGTRPTFGGDELTIETFLLEPLDGDAPEHITIAFCSFLRKERAFPDAASLKTQILSDVKRANSYWRRVKRLAQPSASIY